MRTASTTRTAIPKIPAMIDPDDGLVLGLLDMNGPRNLERVQTARPRGPVALVGESNSARRPGHELRAGTADHDTRLRPPKRSGAAAGASVRRCSRASHDPRGNSPRDRRPA